MIAGRKRFARQEVVFAEPRWNESSPQWQMLDDEIPEDDIARAISRAVSLLDLSALFASYDASGRQPFRPDLMLTLVLLEKHYGRNKPSHWHADAKSNIKLKWAGFGIEPSRRTWYAFRDRLEPFLEDLHRQVLQIARKLEITTAERGALDGTFVAANASRRRMLNKDCLEKRLAQLRKAAASPQETAPGWMAKTPHGRLEQLRRYEAAYEKVAAQVEENQRRNASQRRDPKRIVVSVSEVEAAVGFDKEKVYRPLYNTQFTSDLDSPLILGYGVFAQHSDAGLLEPMLKNFVSLNGHKPKALAVDCGYISGVDLALAQAEGVELFGPWKENDFSQRPGQEAMFGRDAFAYDEASNTYHCPNGCTLSHMGRERRERSGERSETLHRYRARAEDCQSCALRSRCTTSVKGGRTLRRSEHEPLIEAHQAKMETAEAKAFFRLRGQTVERSFADQKEHRNERRFSGRGLRRVRIEVGLTVLTHNLVVVIRATQSQNARPENAVTPSVAA